jgi:hypothetical protein
LNEDRRLSRTLTDLTFIVRQGKLDERRCGDLSAPAKRLCLRF